MYMILLALNLIIFSLVYNLFFKKDKFRKELDSIRKEKILSKPKQQTNENISFSFTPSTSELIKYLNKIIKDNNTDIVKKYFYSFTVFINMQKFLFAIMVLFSLSSFSQEQSELEKNSFLGYWSSNDSSYYLSIKNMDDNLKFSTYKFIPQEDDNMNLSWDRVLSPGTEEFIKSENNIILTNYWIEDQNYYVKITYTLINSENLKAEFNGKLNGEPYYNMINYKRVKLNTKDYAIKK